MAASMCAAAAAAAALRLAGRALRRPSSFPRALLEKQQPRSPSLENIIPRRLYSSDRVIKVEVNKHYSPLHPHATTLHNLGHKKVVMPAKKVTMGNHNSLTDEINRIFDELEIMAQKLGEDMLENIKRQRRRKLLVRGSIFVGIAILVKKQFFDGSQEDKAMAESN